MELNRDCYNISHVCAHYVFISFNVDTSVKISINLIHVRKNSKQLYEKCFNNKVNKYLIYYCEMIVSRNIIKNALKLCRFNSTAVNINPELLKDCCDLPRDKRDYGYPKLGNRDIVGFGAGGAGEYFDNIAVPMPGIRFRPNTADFYALRQLELGDWRDLTIDQKKQLYRKNFRYTYAEFQNRQNHRMPFFFGCTLIFMTAGLFYYVSLLNYIKINRPYTLQPEYKEKMVEYWIRQMQGLSHGIASYWDYDKNEWKKK
ncbi:hypothetical protein A3Q56_02920 [Intoshia linei]|uniref:Cytochrome c oxidase subunit 4 n=1 Tax=Intoshia linei TaxID=1819745 RepID=A0A177B4T8_9BILA|nr:hypothetical protein A3Q56_02920 [Intoshia linei]